LLLRAISSTYFEACKTTVHSVTLYSCTEGLHLGIQSPKVPTKSPTLKSCSRGDYPHNVIDFDGRFDSEDACISYLVSLRWPHGFVCPECSGRKAWRRTRLAMLCASCRHETSIIAGTLFEKTHKPLRVWFKAMWWVTSQKTGASALGLQRILGLGSYETAWLWFHKHRPAMVRSGRDRLTGCVEVDETYVGGVASPIVRRGTLRRSCRKRWSQGES